jgi:hypothetical protein
MSDAEIQESTNRSVPLSEAVAGLHQKQELLLQTTADARTYQDGVIKQTDAPPAVQTSYLTRTTNFPNNLVTHHMKALIRVGLAEQVGQVESDNPASSPGPLPENVYQCTDRGREAVGEIEDKPIGESFDAFRAELESQRDELDFVKGVVMKVAVDTGTFDREEAEEMMPDDQFTQLFDADD